jgi:hypothetical protein
MANNFGNVGAGAINAWQNGSVGNQNGVPVNQNETTSGNSWFSGENVSGWLGGVSSVIDSLKGNQGPDTVIYQTAPPPDTDQNKGLSTGALIGIVVGVILLFVMLLALMARRKKS